MNSVPVENGHSVPNVRPVINAVDPPLAVHATNVALDHLHYELCCLVGANHPDLKRLNLQLLTDNGNRLLALALQTNTFVQSLQLQSPFLTEQGVQEWILLLKNTKTLRSLALVSPKLGGEITAHDSDSTRLLVKPLLQTLGSSSLRHLDTLHLTGMSFTAQSLDALVQMLPSNTGLLDLRLQNVGLDPSMMSAFCEALRGNQSLAYLDLSHNGNLGDKGALAIAKHLLSSKRTKKARLEESAEKEEDGSSKCPEVEGTQNPFHPLKLLNLESIGMGNTGAIALVEALAVDDDCSTFARGKKQTLQYLHLQGNHSINAMGATRIGEALPKAAGLKKLDLVSPASRQTAFLENLARGVLKTSFSSPARFSNQKNGLVVETGGFDMDAHCHHRLIRYCLRMGRYRLGQRRTKSALWPFCLAHAADHPDVIFQYLVNNPRIIRYEPTHDAETPGTPGSGEKRKRENLSSPLPERDEAEEGKRKRTSV